MADIYGQLVKAQFENLSADPSNVNGLVYFNTSANTVKWYDGTAWRTAVDTATTQTLAGKTLTTPVINGGELDNCFVDGYLDLNEESAPSTPSSGMVRVYAKTDKKLYTKNSDGTEQEVGAGGSSGGISTNHITNGTFETDTTGWATYADAAASTPADGTGGSANITIARNTTSPLRGNSDLKITKGAANRQGEGVSYAFTIGRQDKGKKHAIRFDYDTDEDSAYDAGDLVVYVYDVTNATLITPTVTSVADGEGTFDASFDATTSTSYRLIFHVATTNASAWDVYIDNVVVSPDKIAVQGPIVAEDRTVTFTTTTVTSNITVTAKERQVGSWAHYNILVEFTGTNTQGGLNLQLPSGRTLDTSKLITGIGSSDELVPGSTAVFDSVANGIMGLGGGVAFTTTTNFRVILQQSDSTYGKGASVNTNSPVPATIANGDKIRIGFAIPIAEWAGGDANYGQNDVEYAYNSNTTTTAGASDTSSFAYGPGGTAIVSIDSTTDNSVTTKRVRFQTPVQETDTVELQVKPAGETGWVSVATTNMVYGRQSNRIYGMRINSVASSTTDFDVIFGNAGVQSGGTYATSGTAWSNLTSTKWRVIKHKSGQAVGFGRATQSSLGLVKAGQVPGTNTNDSAETGNVGEIQTNTGSGVAITTAGFTTVASITLSAGDWDISANLNAGATASFTGVTAGIATATNSSTGQTKGDNAGQIAGSASLDATVVVPAWRVSLSASTTYYLTARTTGANTTATGRISARRVR